MESLWDFTVYWVFSHSHISGRHHSCYFNRRVLSVWSEVVFFRVYWMPLVRSSRAFYKFPLVFKQQVKVPIVPLNRIRGPCSFNTACNCISAHTRGMRTKPAKSHFMEWGALGIRSNRIFIASPMCFSEGVSASSEGDSLFVVHSHSRKRFANIDCTFQGIWFSIGTLGVDID